MFNVICIATSLFNKSFVEHVICSNVIRQHVIVQQIICSNVICSNVIVQRHYSTYHLCCNVICQHIICSNKHCSTHKQKPDLQTSKSISIGFTILTHFFNNVGLLNHLMLSLGPFSNITSQRWTYFRTQAITHLKKHSNPKKSQKKIPLGGALFSEGGMLTDWVRNPPCL